MRQTISGAKGGGGASFVTKPDTLRSNDSFEILLGLGSGRWKGLTEGLYSLKINGVPMENLDGSSNFEDVTAIFADGNPLVPQLVTFNLGGGGATQTLNTPLSNITGAGPGPWVTGAVGTLNANFIDLRFVVQQLFYQDDKSIRENTATIEIEMRPSGTSTWINPFVGAQASTITYDPNGYDASDYDGVVGRYVYLSRSMFNANGVGFAASTNPNLVIRGKTNSAFVKEVRIAVPNEGTYANKSWEVRARLVEKDTNDADKIQERRNIVFESIGAVINEPLGDHPDWAGQVWLQLHGKASNQFSGFPEVEGIFDTKICKTPPTTVFNPDTRVYSGATWDGSYEEHFTTDPAWQIKEFVEDPIHGLAGLQPGSTLDKWDALEASKYYSELVPDGRGGTHPRFSMNLTINESREVEEMMGFLAGAVNSYTEDVGGGVWRLKVDKPETPLMLFTEDNIFGEFNYSHTDVDTRFNDWRGTFLNEELDYQPDTVRVFDQDDIDTNGMRFTEIALVGCTNRQEALRRLMFRLRVSLNEYKIVTFTTNRVGRYISPLSTILVADAALNSDELVKSTSRVGSISGDGLTATLLRPVRLEVGVNYVMHFTTTDKQTITRTVTNGAGARGDQTVITLSAPLPNNVMAESAVALEAAGLGANPISYRVIGIERSEQDEDVYVITASIIDSGKWSAMDNVSESELVDQVSAVEIDAPTVPVDGMFQLVEYQTEFGLKKVLQVNWNRPGGSYLQGYRVHYRLNDGPWILADDNLQDSYFELQNPEDGIYDFRIIAVDRRGVTSQSLIGRYVFNGFDDDPGRDGNNALIDDTFNEQWWVIPAPAQRVALDESASDYALELPFAASTDLRVHNTAQTTKLARTKIGESMWVRVIADSDVEANSNEVVYNGTEITYASAPVTYGEAAGSSGIPADFDLEIGIDWLDLEGTFVSRTIIGTLTPRTEAQIFTGYAIAPFRGLARISLGYPSQTGKTGSWVVYEPWMGEHQPTADNTAESVPSMTLAPPVTINVSSAGVSNNAFPMTLVNRRRRGLSDITVNTTWEATFPQGLTATINNDPTSEARGSIEITGFSGVASGKIVVSSVHEGVVLTSFIPIDVVVAQPASSGATSGGTAGTSALDTTVEPANSTFYGSANAGPLTVNTGSTGAIDMTATLSFEVSERDIYSEASGKWQWRVPNADPTVGWVDVQGETSSDYGAYRETINYQDYYNGEPYRSQYGGDSSSQIGSFTLNLTKTGLVASTEYQVRLLLRSNQGTTLYFTGSASAQGT